MFSRISNSWELVKASAEVLRADKELLLFPILSMIGLLLVTVTFAVPALLAGLFEGVVEGGGAVPGVVVGFAFYVAQYCVIFFANTALVGAAMIRLDGGDPTVRDGVRIASQRLGTILGYALISATVGMVLRVLSERGGILGEILSIVADVAWNVATYLVVPVLVVEDVGPIEAVKRSARLLKKTWGEQVVGQLSIGLVFFWIGLVALLLCAPVVILALSTGSVALIVLAVLLVVLVLGGLGVLSSTLSSIYSAAVYRYAVQGETGGYFDESLMQRTFRPK